MVSKIHSVHKCVDYVMKRTDNNKQTKNNMCLCWNFFYLFEISCGSMKVSVVRTTIRIVHIHLKQQYQFPESPGAPVKMEHQLQEYIKNTKKPHKTSMPCIPSLNLLALKRPIQKVQCSRYTIWEKFPQTGFGICTYYGLLQCNLLYSAILERKHVKLSTSLVSSSFYEEYLHICLSFHVDRIFHRAYGINHSSSLY